MAKDYFSIAIRNLKSRTLRSWLTIFGIVIGVFLVISLLSLSQGIKGAILSQIKAMGSDVIMVYPGESFNIMNMMSGMELSNRDIETIQRISGVKTVIPINWKSEVVRFEGKKKVVVLYGIPFKTASDFLTNKVGWKTAEGSFPVPGKKEAVVGAMVPKDIFPGIKTGEEIYIKGERFKISGLLISLGNKNDDSMIGIDMNVFQKITGKRKGVPYVMVGIKEGFSQDEVAKNIKEELEKTGKRQRGEDKPPYSVVTSQKMMDMVGNIINIIQIGIFAIAAFAILVGAIGIMNTMYTSVRERTKEIGIMKAVGARTSDIGFIFLIESGIMGMIGGIGGTIFGIGGAKLIEILARSSAGFALKAYVSFPLVFFGLFFSFLIGCLSGYFPARRAAKLKPADSLRYE